MRQAKFRGQRADNKQWVYGTYHYCIGPGKMRFWDYKDGNRVCEDRDVEFNSHWILVHHTPDVQSWTERDTYTAYEVIPETVGQLTSWQDKNGKDIYEGDILMGQFATGLGLKSTRYKTFNFTIVFNEHDSGFCIDMPKGYGNYRFCPHIKNCEVIGNIHQNLELLN